MGTAADKFSWSCGRTEICLNGMYIVKVVLVLKNEIYEKPHVSKPKRKEKTK